MNAITISHDSKILHLFESLISVFRDTPMIEFNYQINAFEEKKRKGRKNA